MIVLFIGLGPISSIMDVLLKLKELLSLDTKRRLVKQ
jgi:hypothetical protein